jgi:hypothetical protein
MANKQNILFNTIRKAVEYLSLRDIFQLRFVCNKLKDKLNQEFIVNTLKNRYSKYLTFGNKLLIHTDY